MQKFTKREIVLVTSMLFAIFLFESFRPGNIKEMNTVTEKIQGGKEISNADAYQLINDYRNAHNPETDKSIYKTTGWQINKKAIENIFKNKTVTSLNVDLAEEDGTLKIIFHGSNSDMRGRRSTKI